MHTHTRGQKFCLLLEGPAEEAPARKAKAARRRSDPPPLDPLEITEGVSYLVAATGKRPRLRRKPAEGADETFVLEPVWTTQPPQLLMLTMNGEAAMVNGAPAPPVALLRQKDMVQFGPASDCVAHVTIYNEPYIGPPPADVIGRTCPVCLATITSDDTARVYVCRRCRTPLHLEGEETPPKRRRECALVSPNCYSCGLPVVMEKGYTYRPEF